MLRPGDQRSALPGYLGKGITSLMFSTPVAKRIIRSNPRPNPLCSTVPYLRRSRYHWYGSSGRSKSNILNMKNNVKRVNETLSYRYYVEALRFSIPLPQHLIVLFSLASTNKFTHLNNTWNTSLCRRSTTKWNTIKQQLIYNGAKISFWEVYIEKVRVPWVQEHPLPRQSCCLHWPSYRMLW